MQVEILYRPSYSVARVSLERKEKIQVESGAMVGMSPDMEMETEAKGGFLKSVSRSMFGGESYLQYTISEDDSIRHSTDLVMELFADNKVTIN